MLDDAFFASGALVTRAVRLQDGTEHMVHFRELTFAQVRAYQLAEKSEDAQVRAGAIPQMIAASVCNPDGTPGVPYEKAQQLKPQAASALLDAILELNGMAGAAAKKPLPGASGTPSGSGTSSPSPSAAVA